MQRLRGGGSGKMRFVGQHDVFGESGKPEELKQKYGMTAADIVKAVRELI